MPDANATAHAESFDPPSGGKLKALWSLSTPLKIPTVAPTHQGIVYRTTRGVRAERDLKLDVYLPEGPGPHPSCVFVHGGGFAIGHRAMKPARYLATRLVREGVAVASIDYRLLQHGGALPRPVRDAKAAIAWWRARAESYHLDPERIFLMGPSAGGAIALLAAGMPDDHPLLELPGARPIQTPPLAGVIDLYAPTDFSRMTGRLATVMQHWLTGERDRAARLARSPMAFVDFPTPLLMLYGDADEMVALSHAHAVVARREAAGLPTALHVYEGAPHAWFNDHDHPAVEPAFAHIVRFIRERQL